jgi:hypothetical protein
METALYEYTICATKSRLNINTLQENTIKPQGPWNHKTHISREFMAMLGCYCVYFFLANGALVSRP